VPATYIELIPSARWPAIVDAVLTDDPGARAVLWVQVGFYVERIAKLPIGPLSEDEEARRDIALKVMSKLEGKSFANLKEWRRREARKQDHASWWTWIKTVSRCAAVDHARVSRENIARRGDNFEWVKVQTTDPFLLSDTLNGMSSFPGPLDAPDLYDMLVEFQDTRSIDRSMDDIGCRSRLAWESDTLARGLSEGEPCRKRPG
jgi:hypothetical protein